MNINYDLLNSGIIQNNLINLSQLTFEVTDACNLKCKYCGYGEFYENHDKRTNKNFSIERAILLLEYLETQWNSKYSSSYKKTTYISFYGGEPLLNMPFIKDVVSWIDKKDILYCHFIFSMTTNALLLEKHIDFLVKHDFHLLISLDGNETNNSYRIDHSGNNSFEKVYKNIKYVKENFPEYFRKNVSFNAVLHNRNDYTILVDFFKKEFDKLPSVSELNSMGISPNHIKEFSEMFKSKMKNLNETLNKEVLQQTLFMDSPEISQLCTFLHYHSGNVFKTYNDLISNEKNKKWIPTGTCLPFGKKMFVTVNGKILPCERISHEYSIGEVNDEEVIIDIEEIAKKYNRWYEKYIPQCSSCYNNHTCKHCIFYNTELKSSARCDNFMSKEQFDLYVKRQYAFLAKHPHLYKRIMQEVVIH